RFLAAGGEYEKKAVHMWEVSTGQKVREFQGHPSGGMTVAFAPDGRTLASGGADSMILLWDVTGRMPDGRWQPIHLTPQELEARWTDLAGDASRAIQAIWDLAASPLQAVPFLQQRLRPPKAVEEQRLAQLIRDLDSDHFAVRTQATEELQKIGELAEPALRKE